MSKRKSRNSISIRIDNQPLRVAAGSTILQAAQQHGIYIPTLCAHKDLAPFGVCRLCVVEVEGMRGFPTACTTPAEDGMVVRTHTVQLQQMRSEILRLILSEHPASCLVCDEEQECREYMHTIRKVGVTTGCRFCPNDNRCELQEVVRYLGVKEIGYPVYYRGLRVEKEDPFYDRDYNLCILCGRCIRVCQDVRLANTLSFKQRGRYTVIGPAFQRSHLEAGCEFCGACVEVCPTGALAEKTRKWEGKPERTVGSTCGLCGIGCRIQLEVKGGEVIGSLPADDPLVNAGHLCVKGRFCITELMNTPERARLPAVRKGGAYVEVAWEQALAEAAGQVAACRPEEFAMLVSADCTTEDLYVAYKLAAQVVGSPHVFTSASLYYGKVLPSYLRLHALSVPVTELRRADVVLCVMADTRFGMSVVGVELRRAQRRGARLLTLSPRDHNLALVADLWLRPEPGKEGELLREMTAQVTSSVAGSRVASGDEVQTAARLLRKARRLVILLGPDFMRQPLATEIASAVEELARACGAGVLPLPVHANFLGAMLVQRLLSRPEAPSGNVPLFGATKRPCVLYLVGEHLPGAQRWADYVIYQHCYLPPEQSRVDVVLPAAAFTEVEGSLINGDGRLRVVSRAAPPPGQAMPDWMILACPARQMGKSGFDYDNVQQVQREIQVRWAQSGLALPARRPQRWPWDETVTPSVAVTAEAATAEEDSLLAYAYLSAHTHRGFPLAAFVEGARAILGEGAAVFNPADAAALGIEDGAEVELSGNGLQWRGKAEVRPQQLRGIAAVELAGASMPLGLSGPVTVRVIYG
ncbi:MAG: 2Fe-2S iron-sulfur cluster-binding protein [bacterium]|jgi:predicted molibdopterin-dependent oxidoreductase YjgC|nr:2Fe-2S iron-sulfur cluster-binding protein [candidate division KSB1 bacterium]MDH7561123.1 2Fe-2S iron-sulfur cluster-binding protein [bacterium]